MDKKLILKALEEAKSKAEKRKFTQSVDLIINLQDLNLKNPEEQVEFFVALHYTQGKKKKICAFVGPELSDSAKKACDLTIQQTEFDDFIKDKKKSKKLARDFDYFIAQGNIMPKVAGAFGRTLGPKGKMPNPKAGCIVPPNANLQPVVERLQNLIKLSAKKDPTIHLLVGKEDQKAEEVADNISTVYDQLVQHLPKEKNNIKSVYLKLTMGKPIKL